MRRAVILCLIACSALNASAQRDVHDITKIVKMYLWNGLAEDVTAREDERTKLKAQRAAVDAAIREAYGDRVAGPSARDITEAAPSKEDQEMRQALVAALSDPKNPDAEMLRAHLVANEKWRTSFAVYQQRLNEAQRTNARELSLNERVGLQAQTGAIRNELLVVVQKMEVDHDAIQLRRMDKKNDAKDAALEAEKLRDAMSRLQK